MISFCRAELTRGACASEEGVESVSREGVECEVDACVRALQPLVEELGALERAHSYLAWIKQINLLWYVKTCFVTECVVCMSLY